MQSTHSAAYYKTQSAIHVDIYYEQYGLVTAMTFSCKSPPCVWNASKGWRDNKQRKAPLWRHTSVMQPFILIRHRCYLQFQQVMEILITDARVTGVWAPCTRRDSQQGCSRPTNSFAKMQSLFSMPSKCSLGRACFCDKLQCSAINVCKFDCSPRGIEDSVVDHLRTQWRVQNMQLHATKLVVWLCWVMATAQSRCKQVKKF